MNFSTNNDYIYLPSKKNPKVALAIDNASLTRNSFKLYNPFSKKAKILKFIVKFSVLYCNSLFKFFFSSKVNIHSDFIIELEKKIGQSLNVSIYFSTDKNKVVLQLQSKESLIIGYLKLAINNVGNNHIKNEVFAAKFLSCKEIIDSNYLLLEGVYEGWNYCLLKELKGVIGVVSDENIKLIINTIETKDAFVLSEHPRVLDIREKLELYGFENLLLLLNKSIVKINKSFKVVYEHGDFVDWNIIETYNGNYCIFDLEYFNKNGLEYMDLFKIYYHRGSLIEKKTGIKLINFMQLNIKSIFFKELFIIFLLKEITIKCEEKLNFRIEKNILSLL